MRNLLARLRAKLRRLNGTANVTERMAAAARPERSNYPRGGADGWGGGGV